MAEGVADAGADRPVEFLDPFAFQPDFGSRIAGLAQGGGGHDPNYVFHTKYVPVGRGMAMARVRFTGLNAKSGTLQIRVHMLPGGDPSRLMLATSDRVALSRLIQQGGEHTVSFEGFADCTYAIYGSILGETDAIAEGLSVAIELPRTDERVGLATEARNSSFGREATRGAAHIISTATPSLEAPVSQLATRQQMASTTAHGWIEELELREPDTLASWSTVYTLQVLQTYGLLGRGARGLGIGAQPEALLKALGKRECLISITGASSEGDLETPSGGEGGAKPDLTGMDALGTTFVNFDFLWHRDPDGYVVASKQWSTGVQRALTALLPGGFAIFTFGYDPTGPARTGRSRDELRRIGRAELEQLALILISHEHEVAQIKINPAGPLIHHADDPRHTACGLIVRRSMLPE